MRVCVALKCADCFVVSLQTQAPKPSRRPFTPKRCLQDRAMNSMLLRKHLMPQLRSAGLLRQHQGLPSQRSSALLRLRSAAHRLLTETQRLQSHHACRFCVFSLDFGFGSPIHFRIPIVCLPLLTRTTFPTSAARLAPHHRCVSRASFYAGMIFDFACLNKLVVNVMNHETK